MDFKAHEIPLVQESRRAETHEQPTGQQHLGERQGHQSHAGSGTSFRLSAMIAGIRFRLFTFTASRRAKGMFRSGREPGLETGSGKLDAGGWGPEAGGPRREARGLRLEA